MPSPTGLIGQPRFHPHVHEAAPRGNSHTWFDGKAGVFFSGYFQPGDHADGLQTLKGDIEHGLHDSLVPADYVPFSVRNGSRCSKCQFEQLTGKTHCPKCSWPRFKYFPKASAADTQALRYDARTVYALHRVEPRGDHASATDVSDSPEYVSIAVDNLQTIAKTLGCADSTWIIRRLRMAGDPLPFGLSLRFLGVACDWGETFAWAKTYDDALAWAKVLDAELSEEPGLLNRWWKISGPVGSAPNIFDFRLDRNLRPSPTPTSPPQRSFSNDEHCRRLNDEYHAELRRLYPRPSSSHPTLIDFFILAGIVALIAAGWLLCLR